MADPLADRARATTQVAQDAIAWLADPRNAAKVGNERAVLTREFRRMAGTARRLEAAVGRPMCVGVFGPSQAGKSYLVSVLARPPGGALEAVLDGERVDFISRINPVGEKESTGLVTR